MVSVSPYMTEKTTVADVTNDDTFNGDLDEQDRKLAIEFGRRLREARESKWPKLTQEVAAQKVGVSLRQYQRWEHGEQIPPFERVGRIVEIIGVDISDLIEPAGALTRDGIKTYFDKRMDAMQSAVEANFYAISELLIEVLAEVRSTKEDD